MDNNNDIIVIKKGLYDYYVNRHDDTILYYIYTPSNETRKVQADTTFESMFGYKAVDHKQPSSNKKQQITAVFNKPYAKKVIVKKTFNNNANNNKFVKKTVNNKFNNRKPTNNKFNNKKQFKPKVIYKTNFNKRTVFYPDSIEGFLAINIKNNPEAQPKDVKIIASFANVVNYNEIKDFKYFKMEHKSNVGHIKVVEGDKLVSYENPLININIGAVVDLLSRFVDVIFVPANDNFVEELLKAGKEVTILYPGKEMKDEYLLYVKSFNGNSGIYHTLSKYYDTFIERIEELKKKKYKTAQYIELTRLSELKSVSIDPIVGTGVTFNLVKQ